MEMLELFIPVKALDDWMLLRQLVREKPSITGNC